MPESLFYKEGKNKARYTPMAEQISSESFMDIHKIFKKYCEDQDYCPREVAFILLSEVHCACCETILGW